MTNGKIRNMVQMTPALLRAGCTEDGRIGKVQLRLLGEHWPPKSGWKSRIAHAVISQRDYHRFASLRGKGSAKKLRLVFTPAQAREVPAPDIAHTAHTHTPAREATDADTAEVVQIWTDGACQPNPGTGGWGWMSIDGDGVITEDFGGAPHATNNRMELTAILRALQVLPDGTRALVMSDSEYAVKGLTIWRKSWQRRNWMDKKYPEAEMPNRDLWLLLEVQLQRLRVHCQWLRGHTGESGNERADHLAALGLAGAMP